MRTKKIITRTLTYTFLCVCLIISVFPFYWMIVGMTNSPVDVIKGKLFFGNHLVSNLNDLLNQYNIGLIIFNSAKVSVLSVIGILIVSSLAAYGFEMYYSKAREKTYEFFLLTMMIPFAALMIPLFKLIVKMKLLNTHTGIIVTALASVFLIFFFRQSFKSFPYEIIQAARVDGAGELKIFLRIFVPSMKSTYAAAAIYAFMGSWNAYLWPLIVLQTNEQKTLTLMVSSMSSAYNPQYGAMMAAIVITTLPTLIVFFSLQKYFVQGMLGSVKQ